MTACRRIDNMTAPAAPNIGAGRKAKRVGARGGAHIQVLSVGEFSHAPDLGRVRTFVNTRQESRWNISDSELPPLVWLPGSAATWQWITG